MPEPQPVDTIPVQLPVVPVGQRWDLKTAKLASGEPAALLLITSPMSVVATMLDRDSAILLADSLRAAVGGIEIVGQIPPIPPTNGQRP